MVAFCVVLLLLLGHLGAASMTRVGSVDTNTVNYLYAPTIAHGYLYVFSHGYGTDVGTVVKFDIFSLRWRINTECR